MAKSRKKAANWFKKGHRHYARYKHEEGISNTNPSVWMPRLTQEMFAKVATKLPGGLIGVPNTDGQPGGAKLLRPTHGPEDDDITSRYLQPTTQTNTEMHLISTSRNTAMWNECIEAHSSTTCRVPHFSVYLQVKRGLCWKHALKCTKCDYTSRMYRLYEEVPSQARGPKFASPNVGLQVGLLESAIGNAKTRVLLASSNISPPNRAGMQHLSNRVGSIISTAVDDDLKTRRSNIALVNHLRGLPQTAPINVSLDSRYNSQTITGTYKQGTNASQAVGLAIECQTDSRDIIGVYTENKLCWVGASLRNKGYDVECPGGHANCTATIAPEDPLSEYNIGRQLGRQLTGQGVLVKHAVTDGDARSAQGLEAGIAEQYPTWKVQRQSDTTHLSAGQFRHTMKTRFTERMFPGSTAELRKEQQKIFSLDVKGRCQKIYTELHAMHTGNMTKIAARMPKVIEATLNCYSGDCSKCRRNAIVCGGGRKTGWWTKSLYLRPNQLTHLNITHSDREKLRALLNIRLGVDALEKTKLNLNTNKNEAANRGLSASLPKNVTFSRNCTARAYAAVHRMNHGIGASLLHKLEQANCPVASGGHVAKAIHQMQHTQHYHREYARRRAVRMHRMYSRLRRIKAYRDTKQRRRDIDVYKKGQLDTAPRLSDVKTGKNTARSQTITHTKAQPKRLNTQSHREHPYSLRSTPLDHTYSFETCS